MNILIVGTSATGSLLTYRLRSAGHQVTVVGHAAYVRAVTQRGLLVEENGRVRTAARFQPVENVETLGDARFDLVLIATKALDTAVAAVQAQRFVRHGVPVIAIQNGIGGIEIASSLLGEQSLFAGITTIPVEELKPAVIRLGSSKGGVGLAPVFADQDVEPLAQLLIQAHFDVRSYSDWRAMKWSKLMLNLFANAIPAILDWPVEQVYADRRLYDLECDALREARSVVKRMKLRLVSLPGYPVPLLVWALCTLPTPMTYPVFRRVIADTAHMDRRATLLCPPHLLDGQGGKRSSLGWGTSARLDLDRGKLDVQFLNGAVVRAGEKVGVLTPINRVLYETLTGIACGEIDRAEYQGQAGRLIRRARTP